VRRPDSDPPRMRHYDCAPIERSPLEAPTDQILLRESQAVTIEDDIPFNRAGLVGSGVPITFSVATKRPRSSPERPWL
jgi:hypothetical protein